MVDPIAGRLGELVMSGWVAEAPTGRDEAFLLLTTPRDDAPTTMGAVAGLLGLTPGRASPVRGVHVELVDGWVLLVVGGELVATRPGGGLWESTARDRGQVVLVIGTAPRPDWMDEDTYTSAHGREAAIGITPLRDQR